jgi:cytochrome c556
VPFNIYNKIFLMADELENQLSRAEKLLKERLTRAGKIARETTEVQFKDLISTVNNFLKEGIDDISESISKSLVNYDKISQANRNFGESLKANLSYLKDNPSLVNKLNQTFKETDKLSRAITQNQEDLITGELNALDVAKNLAQLSQNELTVLLAKKDITNKIEELENEIKTTSEDQKDNLNIQLLAYQKINEELEEADKTNKSIQSTLEEQLSDASKIDTKVGIGGKILKGLDKIPGIGKLLDFGTAEKAMRAMASSGAGSFQVLSAGAKALGPSLKAALGPLGLIIIAVETISTIFKFIKDAMLGASKQIAEFQRGLMVSSEEAEKIRQRAYDISTESSNLADTQGKIIILQKQIVEAQNVTNSALETSIDFTLELGEAGEKLLAQSAILKDNIGLEAEAQAELTRESIRTGKEIEQITKKTAGNIAFIGLEKKIQFDVNKLLTEATKIQGNLRLNFKGSTEEIAKAVAQAKLLGVNLSQLEKVQSSLLNFEESISAELEAELLTGKDFNLERARTLALEGDLVGMAKALNNQGITYNNLQNYNIIQRQAIAKALGMEVNELADALKKQEEYNALQLKARQIGIVNGDIEKMSLREIFEEGKKIGRSEENIIELLGEQIYQRKLAEDAQTKFNKALEMSKEQFEKFVNSGTLDKFASFLNEFINTVAKDGLKTALFKDYGEAIAQDQLEKVEGRKKQEGGKGSLTTQRDILVAKKDVLENQKLGFFESYERQLENIFTKPLDVLFGKINVGVEQKQKDIEIEKLSKAINDLNTQLNKKIDINLDGTRVGTAMAVSAFRVQ